MIKKVIIITGAKGTLGQAAVSKFLSENYHVIATVSSGNSLGFMDEHPEVEVFPVNLSDENQTKIFIDDVTNRHKIIDSVLLLVGGFASGTIIETAVSEIEKMISLNFYTAYNVLRPLLPQMKQQKDGGKIIFIGARPALLPNEGKNFLAYALSKSLLFKLADFINAEVATSKVFATVFVPGTIDTPLNRSTQPDADFSKWISPERLAGQIYETISNDKQSFTGSVLKAYENE